MACGLVDLTTYRRLHAQARRLVRSGEDADDLVHETLLAALAGKGVEIVVPPVSEAPDGGLTLDFLDPDGNLLSLHQPQGASRRR